MHLKRIGQYALCFVLIICAFRSPVSFKSTAFGAENINLGNITHYNGIIFGEATLTQADTEGGLAIQGQANIGGNGYNYDVGASASGVVGGDGVFIGRYNNTNGYPSLLLGGKITDVNAQVRVYGGDIAIKNSLQSYYENLSDFNFNVLSSIQTHYVNDNEIDSFFSNVYNKTVQTTNNMPKANDSSFPISDIKKLNSIAIDEIENKYLADNLNILVLNFDQDSSISIGDVTIPTSFDAYDQVIFCSTASSVTFGGGSVVYNGSIINTSAPLNSSGNAILKNWSEKIIWSFPNANSVTTNYYGVIGSVLAPNATVTGNGASINGMLVCQNFMQKGGMELHSLIMRLGDRVFNIDEPDPDPSPTPSDEPDPDPSPTPSNEPDPDPSPTPSDEPDPDPSPTPSDEPDPDPSPTPSDEPDPDPSPTPSDEPDPDPSPTPSDEPDPDPSPTPSDEPDPDPSPTPSDEPDPGPSPSPSGDPDPDPSPTPSNKPTHTPPPWRPKPTPVATPTPTPVVTPTPTPVTTPTPKVTPAASEQPSFVPTPSESTTPGVEVPSATPEITPTPTVEPTASIPAPTYDLTNLLGEGIPGGINEFPDGGSDGGSKGNPLTGVAILDILLPFLCLTIIGLIVLWVWRKKYIVK